ncbi:MAG: hypothetical protein UX22_C0018G0005 [Candidatus Jorgensenbacteria bacterium GW2011_GWA2_45_9]|uniref:Uncharacterized protein n=1 Tax=Candidatus Jorgensenbacteria bacterium GW2011_GWA2_45_9 TaxID=1618663 RepID=A0A0G1N2I3_9BACT|nr:MAG: hypothetical protein UX22_C0018G0005 [Candidatus Jorgensenbacteria bacterium GW2011_GWA2_45_9]
MKKESVVREKNKPLSVGRLVFLLGWLLTRVSHLEQMMELKGRALPFPLL